MPVIIRTILTVLFAIAGGTTETNWGKNKGRSAEGNLKKATRIMAIMFIVLAVVLNIKF